MLCNYSMFHRKVWNTSTHMPNFLLNKTFLWHHILDKCLLMAVKDMGIHTGNGDIKINCWIIIPLCIQKFAIQIQLLVHEIQPRLGILLWKMNFINFYVGKPEKNINRNCGLILSTSPRCISSTFMLVRYTRNMVTLSECDDNNCNKIVCWKGKEDQ